MQRRSSGVASLIGAALLTPLLLAGGARADEALRDFAQPALRDFSAIGQVVSKNDAELQKIDKNFAQGYRFRESVIQYKEPLKLRVDSRAGLFQTSRPYRVSSERS